MDYLKSVVPSQFMADRGSNLVVIIPGSANVRIGLAAQQVPLNIPQCIARHIHSNGENQGAATLTLQDQMLNMQATPAQQLEREKAYDIIASLLKIPFLDEKSANNSFPRKTVRLDGSKPQNSRNDSTFTWTNVMEKNHKLPVDEDSEAKDVKRESLDQAKGFHGDPSSSAHVFRDYICGEEALKIPPSKPYRLRRPIRRGHLNISQQYPLQQVCEDMATIWDWILNDKLHIPQAERTMYSAILVVPETFDTRGISK
ncbi:actin-related protein [Thalictrum thalictroides]|uniref:Actin-related protein n=1 Tax=Thalictrum thalictroides TaxID=46969 RepID=A0A7J6UVI2_THATH|nr:actin-related protein [Thalictrum thalictroides]